MKLAQKTTSWCTTEFDALVDFARKSHHRYGFATLDAQGHHDDDAGIQLWITCRMTHIFCLAALRGDSAARSYAQHGITSLRKYFYDEEFGGFYATLRAGTGKPLDATGARKAAYAHAFVLLAASSGIQAQLSGADELFQLAADAHEQHFWEPRNGLVCESWDREFSETENYRGINANMHTVEATLAAWDATQDPRWLTKAEQILMFTLDKAHDFDWRIPEHFDAHWVVLPAFNQDQPADPFRPYGFTPGHGLEWSRLALQFWATASEHPTLVSENPDFYEELPDAALSLFRVAMKDGWEADGAPGIVYTTDHDGTPVVHQRMHWTACEALASATVFKFYGQQCRDRKLVAEMDRWFKTLIAYIRDYVIEAPGEWIHELDENNQPAGDTWPGKPDVYHAAQAMLLPQLGLTPGFAATLAARNPAAN